MEQRNYPRITLPVLVELHHPSIGHPRCIVRDVSASGLFVMLEDASFRKGSKLKLTMMNPSPVDQQATPTVEMQVVRVDPEGIALQFANKTSAHLWNSVEQLRDELQIGRDFFQIHQSVVVFDQQQRLLLVQKQGQWQFPGRYLQVGESWSESILLWLEDNFGFTRIQFTGTISVGNALDPAIPEAATFKLFHQYQVDSTGFHKPSGYKNCRWVDRTRTLEELTFAQPEQRPLAVEAMRTLLTSDD